MDQIMVLKGPDRIRKRPAVIFGNEGVEGAQAAVRPIMEIYAAEALMGRCRRLDVLCDGAQLEISGDDRGIYLGQDKDDSVWKNIFCDLFCAPAYIPEGEGVTLGLLDSSHSLLYRDPVKANETFFPEDTGHFALCAVQYASEFMDVISVRDGMKIALRFEKGYCVACRRSEVTQESNGTRFRLKLDKTVFSENEIPTAFFLKTLEQLALCAPGLTCTYTDSAKQEKVTFSYPDGGADYIRNKCADAAVPVFCKRLEAKGKCRYNSAEYEALLALAIGPAKGNGNSLCLHNFAEITYGGAYFKQLQKCVCDAFNRQFLSELKEAATFEELGKHLAIALATWCSAYCTEWENETHLAVENQLFADMVCDAAKAFCDYVCTNKQAFRPIADAITEERKHAANG